MFDYPFTDTQLYIFSSSLAPAFVSSLTRGDRAARGETNTHLIDTLFFSSCFTAGAGGRKWLRQCSDPHRFFGRCHNLFD